MSSGLSVKLPLGMSGVFGAYNLNTTFSQLANQNLKMLVLTSPGERIMNPNFGVGLKHFLFEMNDSSAYSNISSKILEQVKIYLPYLQINDIQYRVPEDNPDLYPHNLSINIIFTIKSLGTKHILQINTAT